MKKILRSSILVLLFFTMFLIAVPAEAAPKYKSEWVTRNGYNYYYNYKGVKLTGKRAIKGRYYYFDSKGRQKTGWLKIGNDYYFFRKDAKKLGYMFKSRYVDGIYLRATGKAVVNASNTRKMRLLITANVLAYKITNETMTKTQKLRACFNYTRDHFQYASRRSFTPHQGWELTFAEDMLINGGRGNCFAYAAAFAFLANAIGYRDVKVVSSGGHGWAEINGLVYDPDWELADKRFSYFALPYSLSGVQGRPNYAPNRAYVVAI